MSYSIYRPVVTIYKSRRSAISTTRKSVALVPSVDTEQLELLHGLQVQKCTLYTA